MVESLVYPELPHDGQKHAQKRHPTAIKYGFGKTPHGGEPNRHYSNSKKNPGASQTKNENLPQRESEKKINSKK